ncbi:MAG: elongation factor P [Anaerolineae bacterium]|nr:elongation factor P [Anaerolineae bacterium]
MIDVNELRRGVTYTQESELYKVIEYHHHKPGRGKATIRVMVRNLRTGTTREITYNSGDRVQDVRLETAVVEYLYSDDEFLHFMNVETFEQPQISAEVFGDDILYLTENQQLKLSSFENEIIDFELPATVEQEVAESEMAVAGDTATGATKQVITITGLKVTVPLFVNVGDVIRIDTRSGDYVTRV